MGGFKPKPKVWDVLILMLFGTTGVAVAQVCPKVSLSDAVLFLSSSSSSSSEFRSLTLVVEGDESALHKAMYLVHKNKGDYVALLFYASWCPFSKDCRLNFNILQSSFPRIRHFAFEESAIRPSILSRYGVHGFPTLFLLNSTMRIRYHGPRTINLLTTFYQDVTGNDPVSSYPVSTERSLQLPCDWDSGGGEDSQNCPFWWARSPEKLLQQDAYLALATVFVIFRLLYFLWPKLVACCGHAWTRRTRNATLLSLSQACFERGKVAFASLNPYKRKKLQGGAMNARAWASQSLASVSIGEGSSGRKHASSETR